MHPLTQRIAELRRAIVWRRWASALGWVAVAALATALVLMLLDYWYRPHDRGLRYLALGAVLVAAGVAIARRVLPVVRRPVSDRAVALGLEKCFPQLGSRLASAIEFADGDTHDLAAGSADLRRAVIVETASQVDDLPIDSVVDSGPLRWAVGGLLGCLAMLGLFAIADSAGLATAASRIATPWSDRDWPREHKLAVVTAPKRMVRGDTFEAIIADERSELPDDLRIIYRDLATDIGGERTLTQPVPPMGEQAIAERENVQRSFAYRVEGGDDRGMAWRQVQVVDPPGVRDLAISVTPPDYTHVAPYPLDAASRVLEGSVLEFKGAFVDSGRRAVLEVSGQDAELAVPLDAETEAAGTFRGEWQVANPDGDEPSRDATLTYRLRIESDQGDIGYTKSRAVRIVPDRAPTVVWNSPASDLLVAPAANLRMAAKADDDFAIQQVEFVVRMADRDAEAEPRATLIPYEGGAAVAVDADAMLAFSSLEVEPGDQLLLMGRASDYRPQWGETPTPRRVTIVSPDELRSIIAEDAATIAADLERALALERNARDEATVMESLAVVDRQTVDRLATLAYEQQQIAAILVDPQRGVATRAEALGQRIVANKLQMPELVKQLQAVKQELARLAARPLPEAEREITAARRDAENASSTDRERPASGMAKSLATAGAAQEEIIRALERLTDRLAAWSDVERFAREAADLAGRQADLARAATEEATRAAADRRSPERQAAREKLAAAQAELTRRLARLQQAMRERLGQDSPLTESASEQDVADALDESEQRATAGKMDDARRQLEQGQFGRATEAQQAAAEDLERIAEMLRGESGDDPLERAERLKQAREQLQQLRDRAQAEASPAGDPNQAERRQELTEEAERLARQIERERAEDAAKSTRAAGGQMQEAAQNASPQAGQQAMEEAVEDLKRAIEQLDEQVEQEQEEAMQTALEQLAEKMPGFIARQRKVLEATVGANDGAASVALDALADEERTLRDEIGEAATMVATRRVFASVLAGVANDLSAAAQLLDRGDASRRTQQRERSALARMRHIVQALTPGETDPNEEDQGDQQGGGGEGGGGEGQPPPIDIAELRMIRLMQLDVNAQTKALAADAAAGLLDEPTAAAESQRLAEEQRALEELVAELLDRQ